MRAVSVRRVRRAVREAHARRNSHLAPRRGHSPATLKLTYSRGVRGWLVVAALACFFDERRDAPVERPGDGSVIESEPRAMIALEDAGLSLARVLGADGPNNDALVKTAPWAAVRDVVDADIRELEARPDVTSFHPRKRFQTSWLSDPRARFELVAAVNRLDRTFLDPNTCGEARLIYRLVIAPEGRSPSSLPMTINLAFAQPKPCAESARRWAELPAGGPERVTALRALFAKLPGYTKLEINLQTFHGTAKTDVDANGSGYYDHAEYLLRSFDRVGDTLRPRLLIGTPRFDLDAAEKRDLAAWVRANFEAIDAGDWVVPDRFLATRALSVTPRAFARMPNRVFRSLLDEAAFADLPYAEARLVRSPAGLLRRLDQGTCEGCHETRSVAGFHMLGESRAPVAHFDAVAIPRSAHFDVEADWRAAMTMAVARGQPFDAPRPFAERKRAGPGRAGAHCAINADPTFAGWTCMPGLACHSLDGEIGECRAAGPKGIGIGDACEDATTKNEQPGNGPLVHAKPSETCHFEDVDGYCEPNLYGFPGGMCELECSRVGAVTPDGEVTCGQLPESGYENECFLTSTEPIETCISRYLNARLLRTCGPGRPCRDDYACARTVGAPPKMGVCMPTYSVYGLRDDGPILDR